MKYVYLFKEGNKDMKNILGGKGANLAEMTSLGLPVPQGFTVTTEACNLYYEQNETLTDEIIKEIFQKLEELEKITEKQFGSSENPLLVSVRSGARASMPGMMDTVLNLGMNDIVASSLINLTNNKRFVYDSYRRFISMYADVVMGYSKESFSQVMDNYKKENNILKDQDMTAEDLEKIVNIYKENYEKLSGSCFPQDPKLQLLEAIKAVFRSWETPRAKVYRKMNDIPSSWGTAVNVQEMVYGNIGENSGTGVAFSRNPVNGKDELYGEYLINAQGEDVVAGIRTPSPISHLKEDMSEVYDEFYKTAKKLEEHYKDMQDMEFTIENGKLFMLQTRNGKRTVHAALKIASDMVKENKITKEEAILSLNPNQLDALLHPNFDEEQLKGAKEIGKGLPASPGAAVGKIYFNAKDALLAKERKEDVILVRLETSPEDIEGMNVAKGILTVHGGMTSHAAVVARGMGRCCITGCDGIELNEEEKTLTSGDIILKEGDYISLNGNTGIVYLDKISLLDPVMSEEFNEIMSWANEFKTLQVYANADTEKDAKKAIEFGAKGIGLCRTEHMFFKEERIIEIRKMIVAEDETKKQQAINKLYEFQKEDFVKIFTVMKNNPVTIRYMDPPLHEFLPNKEEEIKKLAIELEISEDDLKDKIEELKEVNPMMGHRGCRLAITTPELLKMQTKAIMDAALEVKKSGIDVEPELMLPLVGDIKELKYLIKIVTEVADNINREVFVPYKIGTMIEVPRAAIIADQLAKEVDFFSFGTNDLTQMTYGFSRDDAAKFLTSYYDKHIFDQDPFEKLDQEGVGALVKMAATSGRKAKPSLKLGICGEHGGEPTSVEFCHNTNLNYVSCSPYRIPIAILASAQAALKNKQKENVELKALDLELNETIDNNIEKNVGECFNLVKKYGFNIELDKKVNDKEITMTFKIRKTR